MPAAVPRRHKSRRVPVLIYQRPACAEINETQREQKATPIGEAQLTHPMPSPPGIPRLVESEPVYPQRVRLKLYRKHAATIPGSEERGGISDSVPIFIGRLFYLLKPPMSPAVFRPVKRQIIRAVVAC